MTIKYFVYPFGINGTLAAIPDPTQGSGVVSYQEGFGVDYQLIDTDPASLNIPRDQFNQLMFDTTGAVQQIQQNGFPVFITTAMNDGSPFPYSKNSWVRAADGNVYFSLIDVNTDTPPSSNWQLVSFSFQSFLTGDTIETYDATLPSGWLWLDGKTIGSASSGATGRANADTSSLFTVLWNSIPNAALPIQDSAGTPSTRGVSAAADFSANKRLPVPDRRGRIAAAADNLGGTAANRLTGNTAQGVDGSGLGNFGGEQSHALISTENGTHTHGSSGLSGGSHSHTFSTTTDSAGAHTHDVVYSQFGNAQSTLPLPQYTIQITSHSNDSTIPTNSAGVHTHTLSGTTGNTTPAISGSTDASGSGTTHNNVQPTIIANFRIKL